jgi:hypothetical protein
LNSIAASQSVRVRKEVKILSVVSVRLKAFERHPIIFLKAAAHPSWNLSVIHAFQKKRCLTNAISAL